MPHVQPPYDWAKDDHPADLLARNESDEHLIWLAQGHLPLVADLLEAEMRAAATLAVLKEIEKSFDD